MIKEIWSLFVDRFDFFMELLFAHVKISLIAILIAIVVGGLFGVLISEYRKSARFTLGTINFLYTIPSISMFGFLIPFSGVGNTTAIIALTVYALLPMVRNTYTGITNVDPLILEAAAGMGSTRWQVLYKIKLPLAMPIIMSGIRNMTTMTIALGGIASFIGAGGLGVAIYRGITTNNTAMTMVGSLLIALLALAFDFVLGIMEKKLSRGKNHKAKRKERLAFKIIIPILCIFLIIAMVTGRGERNTIYIGTKPMTEQYILGEMLKIVIEDETNLKVELTQGIGGGTSNIEPAMEKGELDIYPEYTGTGWNMVLKEDGVYQETLFNKLTKRYEDELSMKWLGMYGFNNTYGIAVRRETAEKYNLKSYSDLQRVAPSLQFGGEYDFFERAEGYDALCSTYVLEFASKMDMDIGLKYDAINSGKIDVMVIFTTDGQLANSDLVVLEDDRNFYPSYTCGNVVRYEVLKEHPELVEVLEKFTGTISDKDMAKMNYQVEVEKKEPKDVAKKFLQEKALIK